VAPNAVPQGVHVALEPDGKVMPRTPLGPSEVCIGASLRDGAPEACQCDPRGLNVVGQVRQDPQFPAAAVPRVVGTGRLSPLTAEDAAKGLAIVHAAGSPDTTRSHFDAQDCMESGTPGVKSTQDGWLNRALQAEDLNLALRHRCAQTCEQHTAFRAVALGNDVPRTLAGKIPAIALANVNGFTVAGRGVTPSLVR